jgi:RNA polymerase sigma-70 factor (ECF subfamily)
MSQVTRYIDGERAVGRTVPRDDDLIAQARRGDHEAFTMLIEPRALRLLRTARAILGNEADAFDAAQEALVAAWVHMPGLRDVARFDAWLSRTLVNKCRDARRKRGRVREIDMAATDLRIDDGAAERAQQKYILAAFDRVSVEQRHILVLHYLHELPLAQIADQLHIPVGTAKSRLWAARRALEHALEAEA